MSLSEKSSSSNALEWLKVIIILLLESCNLANFISFEALVVIQEIHHTSYSKDSSYYDNYEDLETTHIL